MKRLIAIAAMSLMTVGFATGCFVSSGDGAAGKPWCPKCGQTKGAPACCKADAVTCAKCGMQKGSPGCCKPKG